MRVINKEMTREISIIPVKTYVMNKTNISMLVSLSRRMTLRPRLQLDLNLIVRFQEVSLTLIAHFIVQKYTMGMPLYRQEQYFKRQGIQQDNTHINPSGLGDNSPEWFKIICVFLHDY